MIWKRGLFPYGFIETYVGFNMADITWSEKEDIISYDTYKNMLLYPLEGAVQKIEDIWL